MRCTLAIDIMHEKMGRVEEGQERYWGELRGLHGGCGALEGGL